MLSDPFTNLNTGRLLLRELHPEDAEEIFRLRTDDSVNEFLGRPRAVTIDDARDFIQKILTNAKNNKGVMWVITLPGDTKLAGTVVFWNIEPEKAKAEIGYELLPEHQGKGIMTEALKKVIDFGFKELQFKTICAETHPKNQSSIKLLKKLGFAKSGKSDDGCEIYELKAL
jgi:[ribosomal protein S5]-alanine N-acetyltransferase